MLLREVLKKYLHHNTTLWIHMKEIIHSPLCNQHHIYVEEEVCMFADLFRFEQGAFVLEKQC